MKKKSFGRNVELEEISKTPDASDVNFFVEVDLKCPDESKERKKTPFCPENKINPQDKFSKFMKDFKLVKFTQNNKIICDWTDINNYFLQNDVLHFYIRW